MSLVSAADFVYAMRIATLLATPWEKMEAFKLGIIDKDGVLLKKKRDLATREEKEAYTYLHRMVFNLKRVLQKASGGSNLVSASAALYLLKEFKLSEEQENVIMEELKKAEFVVEDTPTNVSGGEVSTDTPTGSMAITRRNWKDMPKFANSVVFDLEPEDWQKFLKGKTKGCRWNEYFEEGHCPGEDIKAYANTYPKRPIIVKNVQSGAMQFLKYGSLKLS